MINICGIIYHKYTDGDKDGNDLVKVRDPERDGIYEVISITHNIHMEQIIFQNYTHDSTIIRIKKI